jgi:TPR repeat protein
MGRFYKEGIIVEMDIDQAIFYYDKSYELGYIDSLNAKGYLYKHCKNDIKKAIEFYEEAANFGSSKALFNLAINYEEGNGVIRNLGIKMT